MTIRLTAAQRIKLINADDLFTIMRDILIRENKIDRNREHYWVVGLEQNNRILFIELISMGTVNAVLAEPMEVFSFALQKRAVKIILVHNHPSGDVEPSEGDKDMADKMIQVGLIVNTPVDDCMIISKNTFVSFKSIGLLDKLSESTKYVPGFMLEAKIRKEEEKIRQMAVKEEKEKALEVGIKKGKKEGLQEGIELGKQEGLEEGIQQGELAGMMETKFEIAARMKKNKEPDGKIMKYTGLTKK